MRSTDNHARFIVLRELSLLRALGASRRTFGRRSGKPGRSPLPLSPLARPDAFALLPAPGAPHAMLATVKTPLDEVSKLK
jgi:hypothetical protein